MNTPHRTARRVTGHLRLIERREGPVWYAQTRVPGRTPEQTLRRLAPAHLAGGKPPAGHLTRRQAQDALADLLADERRKVGHGAYDHVPRNVRRRRRRLPAPRRARPRPRVLDAARLRRFDRPLPQPALGRLP